MDFKKIQILSYNFFFLIPLYVISRHNRHTHTHTHTSPGHPHLFTMPSFSGSPLTNTDQKTEEKKNTSSLVSLGFCCSVVIDTRPQTVTVKRDRWRMMKCPDVTCFIIRTKRTGLRCRGRMQLRVSVTERHWSRTKQPCIPPFAILTNFSEMVSP